uniref:Uncharacterized protein n=1 Tax=Sphaerodactylus townsendi TaxID=933632 RepID=A0ACB8F5K7_9SAUR
MTILLEVGKEILVGDIGDTIDDLYLHFVQMLPGQDCHYILYDATYETKESKKEDLVFIFWVPECAPLKSKMIYASLKDAIKKKLSGIKHQVAATPQGFRHTVYLRKAIYVEQLDITFVFTPLTELGSTKPHDFENAQKMFTKHMSMSTHPGILLKI